LPLRRDERLFIAGCTHPGEEKIVLRVYRKLISLFPDLRLLLAPRHPERTEEIIRLCQDLAFSSLRISRLNASLETDKTSGTIFILDTLGQLVKFYAAADLVFVGGSFVKKGGHNIIEPASLAKPVIFGPIMYNFQDIADSLLKNNAAIQVKSETELFQTAKRLLRDSSLGKRLGLTAQGLVLREQGATQRTTQLIKEFLACSG
jgi:3-deoxy-D-manno-octulosonic-acid transferase